MAFSDLQGKTAIVTGAGGGIGAAIVERLLSEGCSVLASDISDQALERLAERFSDQALHCLAGDVSQPELAERAVGYCRANLGGVDLLACAAGILGPRASVAESDVTELDRIFAVNFRGTFLFLRAVLPEMIAQGRGGSIVTISSIGAARPRPGFGIYGASKSAVETLSQTAALENGVHGIRVNSIAPGSIDTPMLSGFAASAGPKPPPPSRPIARPGQPAEVAALAAFLLSAASSYCTGSVHRVDGGLAI